MRIRVFIASLAAPVVLAGIQLLGVPNISAVRAQRVSATAAPAAGTTAAATAEVKIDNFSFSPATISVAAGTTITWTNRDDIPHTVVSDDKVFKSKVLDTDEKFTYTFSKPGTYPYFCSVHPKMTGKVVVQ
jgi:plastocyanin